ncbi:DinB family protein [Kineosporia sp. NBRC 101731]|uniref:DinB family protein n=1 Tax=Kineosporia sp. NBRC 101731 TaxID=3032199 RepID=UPI0024A584C0|nr:DinB family protein [Kineosporia sp. NBRC 101731]GLY32181.1 DNA damage-inducible protein DinB [Kineosporia sp. NBRC 101731]
MESPRRDLLRWQFDLAWSFFEYHLERLESEDFLWEPGPLCWTLHAQADGSWVPDWAESQPDPIPVPTIAWTSWHLGWWLGAALDQAHGGAPRDPSEVEYPGIGDAAVDWLRTLGSQWRGLLEEIADEALDAPSSFPWPVEAERSLADMAGWVNAELMKNAAEIGTLRLLRASAVRP